MGQNLHPAYRLNYLQDVQTFYRTSDQLSDFSKSDAVRMANTEVTDSISTMVYTSNDITITVFHLNNSLYEDWMVKPFKTVINSASATSFDAAGNVLMTIPYSNKYIADIKSLKKSLRTPGADIIPDFTYFTADLKKQLTHAGYVYHDLGSGNKQFLKAGVEEFIFNNDELTNEEHLFSGNEIIYSIKKGFRLNASGIPVPSYTLIKQNDESFANNCVQKITVTKYPSYEILYYVQPRLADVSGSKPELVVFPNPAEATLSLELNLHGEEKISVRVFNTEGKLVKEESLQTENEETATLNIQDLSSGLYMVSVSFTSGELSTIFYKK